MPEVPQWARVKTAMSYYHLRRGAWYQVLRTTHGAAVLEVNDRVVAVPSELVQILPTRPRSWSVVPRPLDAVDLPLSWGSKYAVCPKCGTRAPLGRPAPSMRCTGCGDEFEINWSRADYLE